MLTRRQRLWLPVTAVLLLLLMTVAACRQQQREVEVTREVTRVVELPGERIEVEVEVTRIVEVEVVPEMAEMFIPFHGEWQASAHGDLTALAFNYWNESADQAVPVACAKCHSTYGFLDFLGADGSEFGVVNEPAALGSVVTCEACHNDVAVGLTSVTFPSGAEIHGLGSEARCMQCHQGRASTVQVNASIERAGLSLEDLDTVSPDLGFTNIHYFAAAATQYGSLAQGGYEYPGKRYDGRFEHVEPYQKCVDCHNPHTLEVEPTQCATCHENVRDARDFVNIRMQGSLADFDGNGNLREGIYYEIVGLREILYAGIQAYANEVSGTPIGYFSAHPYFFIDSNADGQISAEEANFGNRYNAWTPRLAMAAFNYQVSYKDTGAYMHNAKYIIQLLYDSIEDINSVLSEPVDVNRLRRIDHGHFAATEQAFRNWDAQGAVPATCSKCHTADGLPFFLTHNVNIAQPPSNGLSCLTCHTNETTFEVYEIEAVTFPSGAVLSLDSTSNTCLNCHQGRESTVSMNRLIGNIGPDETAEQLRFLNIHYFAAGATLFGSEAQGAYQYNGQEYIGRNPHVPAFDTCTECHSTHALEVKYETCTVCHDNVTSLADLRDIRVRPIDYSGNGDAEQGLYYEIATLKELLYAEIVAYAREQGNPIVYSSTSFPYYYNDLNDNGILDDDERNVGNRYNTWTPRLLRAAYNYQYASKDPGAFAHNGLYIIQVLQDSLADIGHDISGMIRPTADTD
jgi:hypothetical protein